MDLKVEATGKGKHTLGPLEFTLNGITYTTNKIEYEVVDPLPAVTKGIWIRTVFLNDSTFCLLIDQRIPEKAKTTVNSDKSTTYTNVPDYPGILKLRESYSVPGLSGNGSSSNTSEATLGEDMPYLSAFSIYYFKIKNGSTKIVIPTTDFENIPADYSMKDIVVLPPA